MLKTKMCVGSKMQQKFQQHPKITVLGVKKICTVHKKCLSWNRSEPGPVHIETILCEQPLLFMLPGHFCLVLQRLILNLFHRNLSPVDGGDCQVPAVQRVASRHHVARGEHLVSISSTFYEQLLRTQIPKAQKRLSVLHTFCAFGIWAHKSRP